MVRIGLKKFLAHFVSFFVYAFLHLVSYAPRFCHMKDLNKIYISVVTFIRIAFVVVKLKVFGLIQHP